MIAKINTGLIFLIGVLLLSFHNLLSQENPEKINIDKIQESLSDMEDNYSDLLYKAFFSIDELRPYSIIQIDKISKIYDNKWISPEQINLMLDDNDRKLLSEQIAVYIDNINDYGRETAMLNIIKYWCIASLQFDLLLKQMGISHETLAKAFIASTAEYINPNTGEMSKMEGTKLTPEIIEKNYFETLNHISSLALVDQFRFYSNFYSKLSELIKK